jgi:ribosomal protein RSM22 (predicted rRNA methylase)
VTLAYVLDELEPTGRDALVRDLWAQTGDTLLLVEPGTPAGYARILRARALLLEAGAHLVAPCPHAGVCPLVAPDWCHFAARIPRSSLHRRTKSADLGWEDEKYSYVAASRSPAATEYDRVLAPPLGRSGLVSLKLCTKEGRAETRRLSKRDGDTYKRARRLGWGDAL